MLAAGRWRRRGVKAGLVATRLHRSTGFDEALTLADDDKAGARRVTDDAGRGLGKLLAAVANLTVPQMIVLGGEGVGLVNVARDAVRARMAEDRDPRADDNTAWCRGAAVYVSGS